MHNWQENPANRRAVLFGIVSIALVVRLAHLWAMSQGAWIDRHLTAVNADDHAFFEWAQTIIAGDWWGRDTYHPYFSWMREMAPLEDWYRWWGGKEIFHQAPFYPYFLAVLLILFNGSVQLVLTTQMLIGSVQVLIIYAIATRFFDQKVGLVAAGITALYGPFIFHEGILLRDWLVPVVEPLAVLLVLHAREKGGPLKWTIAGAGLGLAILCKASSVVLVGVVFAWLVYDRWGRWRDTGRAVALMLLGIILCTSPLLVRNVTVGAPMFAVSNRLVEAFVLGNTRRWHSVMKSSRGQLFRALMITLGFEDGTAALFLDRQVRKAKLFVDAYEAPNNTSYYYGLENSSVLRWMLAYGFLFPFAITGLVLTLKRWRYHLLLLLYGLSTSVVLLLTSPIARYRIALVPVLIVFAAVLLVRLAQALRHRRLGAVAGILALVVGLAFIQWNVKLKRRGRGRYIDYPATVWAYGRRGDLRAAALEAARFYKAAARGGFVPAIREATTMEGDFRIAWALQLIEKGDPTLAKEQVALASKAYSRHPNFSSALFNLGVAYAELGQTAQARELFERFLVVAPDNPQAVLAKEHLSRIERATRSDPSNMQR